MTRYAALLVVLVLSFTALGSPVRVRGAEAFVVDPTHSSIVFKIRHVGISWFFGRFDEMSGEIAIDKQDPANSSFNLTIKVDSVDTNNSKRNEHLRSPDFFNAKQFPLLTFKSTSVKPVEGGYEVTGDFTMHGVTKPISFVLQGGKEVEFPKGKVRTGFTTEFSLNRSDFGVGSPKLAGLLGEDVHIEIGVEAVKKTE
jgi:polyisoprenoid-binding protein YceI